MHTLSNLIQNVAGYIIVSTVAANVIRMFAKKMSTKRYILNHEKIK